MIDALAVVGMAAVPVGELRFAVPWAMLHFGFPWYQAFFLALVGNLIPVLVLPVLLSDAMGHLLLDAPKPVGSILRWRIERLKEGAGPTGYEIRAMGAGAIRSDAASLYGGVDGLPAGVGYGHTTEEVFADAGPGSPGGGHIGDDIDGVGSFNQPFPG